MHVAKHNDAAADVFTIDRIRTGRVEDFGDLTQSHHSARRSLEDRLPDDLRVTSRGLVEPDHELEVAVLVEHLGDDASLVRRLQKLSDVTGRQAMSCGRLTFDL